MRIITSLVLIITLSGCVLFSKHEPMIPPSVPVQVDKSLLEFCPLLNEKPLINTFDDVITEYATLSSTYGACATKQAAAVNILKSMGNIQ